MGRPRADVKWMNFSGAPALLVPRSAMPAWNGYYQLAPPEAVTSGDADFVAADGRAFVMHLEFDFDAPVTDYDRLCAPGLSNVRLVSIGGVAALYVSDGADSHGWWHTRNMLVTNADRVPTEEQLARATWHRLLAWTIHEPDLVLFNSCFHGEDAVARALAGEHDDEIELVRLEPGEYGVDQETSDIADAARLYRLVRT